MQHQAHCPTHQAAKAIKSIQKSAKCLEQQLENEYQKRERAETDAATMRRTMNEMEEDREILVDKLIKKDKELKTIHATDARHQRSRTSSASAKPSSMRHSKRSLGARRIRTSTTTHAATWQCNSALKCSRTRPITRKETQRLRGTTRYAASPLRPLQARAAAHDTFAETRPRTSARAHARAHWCECRTATVPRDRM